MARTPVRRASDEAAFSARLTDPRAWLTALIPILLIGGLVLARAGSVPSRPTAVSLTGAAPNLAPDQLKAAAADTLEAATAKGGSGYAFEIVQRSTVTARPGGPAVPVFDPADPRGKPIGETDRSYLIGLVETGFVTPAGFSMEMRAGPPSPEAKVDLTGGQLIFRALVKDGATYRDDGRGWYPTDDPPGIGLDPRTAALLPRLLRDAAHSRETDAASVPMELAGGGPSAGARTLLASAEVADLPGVVAVDGATFTEITAPIALTFDASGRLTGLLVTARNTNLDTFDLVVVTEIALHYDGVPSQLPDPKPTVPADAAVEARP